MWVIATAYATDGWRTWAPVASVVIAFVALLVALSNRGTSRQALRLSQEQEKRRGAKLDLSLRDAVSLRGTGDQPRWIGVDILAVNPTDRDGAMVAADLHVTYRSGDRPLLLKVPHTGSGRPLGATRQPIDVPAPLPANGAIAGWLIFRLDADLIKGPIDRYDVVVTDSRGPVEVLQPWAFKEVRD
jgi:hypothetical protein